jgi:glutamate-ammonia-ligase adenylyltransferase
VVWNVIDSEFKDQLEVLCSDIDRQTLEDFFARMDRDYFSSFSPRQVHEHLKMASALSAATPLRLKVTCEGESKFTVIVVAFDYFSELATICGLLASFGLDIESAGIYTFAPKEVASGTPRGKRRGGVRSKSPPSAPGKIVDAFNVRVQDGQRFDSLEQETFARELAALMKLLNAGQFEAARDRLNRRLIEYIERSKAQFAGLFFPVDISFDNESSGKWTVMHVHSKDTRAFLYALSNALAMRGIYIHNVAVASVEGEVRDRFEISDRKGRKIESEREQEELRVAVALIKQFTHFLPGAPDPARALRYFDQLLDRIRDTPTASRAMSFFVEEDGFGILAQLLGSSDFLWEDFLGLQHEKLLPLMEELRSRPLRPGREWLTRQITQALDAATTREGRARALNEFKDREMFFLDVKHLLDTAGTLLEFSESLTDLAEAVVGQACRVCYEDLIAKHGRSLNGSGRVCPFAVLGLGKFGGREMGYASDLELMFAYEGEGRTDGSRPVDIGLFFEYLAQQVIDLIIARQDGIFHIDLRLRPYGKAGRLASPVTQVTGYYSAGGDAHPFERQSMIKLRWVAGDEALGRRLEAHRDRFVYSGKPWNLELALHLRKRQVRELVTPGAVNVKYSPGGLIDIEYAVQYLQLMIGHDYAELRTPTTLDALEGLCRHQVVSNEERDGLRDSYIFLRLLIDALRIVRGNARDLLLPEEGSDEYKFLARRLGYHEADWASGARKLARDIGDCRARVNRFFLDRFDPSRQHAALIV